MRDLLLIGIVQIDGLKGFACYNNGRTWILDSLVFVDLCGRWVCLIEG